MMYVTECSLPLWNENDHSQSSDPVCNYGSRSCPLAQQAAKMTLDDLW